MSGWGKFLLFLFGIFLLFICLFAFSSSSAEGTSEDWTGLSGGFSDDVFDWQPFWVRWF